MADREPKVEESLKQRLVGALVLLLLAVIFLPLILDGRDEDYHEPVYKAPPEPVVQISHQGSDNVKQRIAKAKEQFREDRLPDDSEDVEQDEVGAAAEETEVTTPVVVKQKNVSSQLSSQQQANIDQTKVLMVKESAVTKRVKESPVSTKMPLADAWTVQVAAFSELSNAKSLQSKLIAKSYTAYIDSKASLHRVFVGPEVRKRRAKAIRQAIEKEFKLRGMIKSYQP